MKLFTRNRAESVAALGEQRLIAEIRKWLGDTCPAEPFGIGDDCAVVPSSGRRMLITTDPVIFGRHFDESVSARAVGAKLLKRNLSDIAAMGGRPVAAVLSLALASPTRVDWLREFYRGLASTARRHRVKIVGGDVAQAPRGFFGAFLTLHGEAEGNRVLTRRGAHLGDWIFVTGALGGSRAGHHHRFEPRLAEGAWLARQSVVVAMMDLTDGIAKDIWALTPPGAVGSVDAADVPVAAAARRASKQSGRPAWEHALCDGEDYELLLSVRDDTGGRKFAARWKARFRTRLTCLGRFQKLITPGHVNWGSLHGYEHLR